MEYEQEVLKQHSVQKLYIKFFDIAWDESGRKARPIARIIFTDTPTLREIVPVTFITNQALEKTNPEDIDSLALKTISLVREIISVNHLPDFNELQIDCDWTKTTKDKYFQLLRVIKNQIKDKTVSATIRLHQLRFSPKIGVPPVDRGLLMCYNMGNLTHPGTRNSIIEKQELEKYIPHIKSYQLPLDVALPLFDWYAWFRNHKFRGLVRSSSFETGKHQNWNFEKDTSLGGYHFKKGDQLRYENSDPQVIKKSAELLEKQISSANFSVVLFHLDEYQLRKFTSNELEDIFHSFN